MGGVGGLLALGVDCAGDAAWVAAGLGTLPTRARDEGEGNAAAGGGVLLLLDGCGRQGVLRLDDGAIGGGVLWLGDGCAGCEVLLFSDGCLDTGLTQDSRVLRWAGKVLRWRLDRVEETLCRLGVFGLFGISA